MKASLAVVLVFLFCGLSYGQLVTPRSTTPNLVGIFADGDSFKIVGYSDAGTLERTGVVKDKPANAGRAGPAKTYRSFQQVYSGFIFDGQERTPLNYGTFVKPCAIDGKNIVGTFCRHTPTKDESGICLFSGSLRREIPRTVLGVNRTIQPTAISGNTIVGAYAVDTGEKTQIGSRQMQVFQFHGAIFDGKAWAKLDVPDSTETYPCGVSGNKVVGWYKKGKEEFGFLYDGAKFKAPLTDERGSNMIPVGISGGAIICRAFVYSCDGKILINIQKIRTEDGKNYEYNFISISGNTILGKYFPETRKSGECCYFVYNYGTGAVKTLKVPEQAK